MLGFLVVAAAMGGLGVGFLGCRITLGWGNSFDFFLNVCQ